MEYIVRPATKEDMKHVRDMIQELANFENMPDGPKITSEELIKDGGFSGQKAYFHCYVAQAVKSPLSDRPLTEQIVGYAICFFSYSTWSGKSYFMEDIYVRPEYREHGIGKLIVAEVVRKAQEFECKRVGFHVLDWNPAQSFYERLGATNLTKDEGWHFYRFDENQMKKFLDSIPDV